MILLVDKPAGMTSQKVVSRIKHASTEKLKIGHTGTLDPMCTGLLPILTGRDTKLTQFFPHEKSYLASIRFGLRTDTGDVTGETLETSLLPTEDEVRKTLPAMVGPYQQVPPMYSAVHVEGKRLYELARMGVEVERAPRQVEIFDLAYVDRIGEDEYRFSVSCSSGTYIRTLCEDIASKMGLCATMSALRRTSSNGFLLEDARSLENVVSYAEQDRLDEIAISSETAFSHLSPVTIPENGEHYYLNGGALTVDRISPRVQDGLYRAYSVSQRFLGLAQCEQGLVKSAFSADI
ncbi:MAG: tRNA pseudouridine(55) synthase TruB [Clostridia bacterium]|nr:tRNA pseudouridine(55) synthase TruB [Clostridia bacterium]